MGGGGTLSVILKETDTDVADTDFIMCSAKDPKYCSSQGFTGKGLILSDDIHFITNNVLRRNK